MNTALTLHRTQGKPRVLDTELAVRLGMPQPRLIRANLIEANRPELEGFGRLIEVQSNPGAKGGRPGRAFYLNEEQATLVVMFSRTPKAAEARREIIAVFTAWRRGELEKAAPKPALPDFTNPVLMAREWANQLEATLLAQATAQVQAAEIEALEGTLEEQRPPVEAGERTVSQRFPHRAPDVRAGYRRRPI